MLTKSIVTLFLMLLIIVFHTMVLAWEVEPEHSIVRRWAIPLENRHVDNAAEFIPDKGLAFKTGKNFGFASFDGTLQFFFAAGYGLAYSDRYYIPYSQVSEVLAVYRWGSKDAAGIVREPGYPMFLAQHLYILSPAAKAISEWTTAGKLLWRQNSPAVITHVAVNKKSSFFATLSGIVSDEQGQTLIVTDGFPVYALKALDSHIFLLQGFHPQRARWYELIENDGQYQAKLQTEYAFESAVSSRVPAVFYRDNSVVFATAKGFMIFYLNGSRKEIDTFGERVLYLFSDGNVIFSVQESSSGDRFLNAWDENLQTLYKVELSPDSDFARAKDGVIYLVAENNLVSFSMRYE